MHKAPVFKGATLKRSADEEEPDLGGHVFGKNLEERVINSETDTDKQLDTPPPIPHTEPEDNIQAIRKRKFDAITGEEDEETIFQGDFKLFIWDRGNTNWIEKGRGQLKLNDSKTEHNKSRLIARVSGTLRIILNVSIKSSTFKILACSNTNIRFTDGQTVWAASGSHALELRELVEARILPDETSQDQNAVKKQKISGEASVEPKSEADKTAAKTSIPSESEEVGTGQSDSVDKTSDDGTNRAVNDDVHTSEEEQEEEQEQKSTDQDDENGTSQGEDNGARQTDESDQDQAQKDGAPLAEEDGAAPAEEDGTALAEKDGATLAEKDA